MSFADGWKPYGPSSAWVCAQSHEAMNAIRRPSACGRIGDCPPEGHQRVTRQAVTAKPAPPVDRFLAAERRPAHSQIRVCFDRVPGTKAAPTCPSRVARRPDRGDFHRILSLPPGGRPRELRSLYDRSGGDRSAHSISTSRPFQDRVTGRTAGACERHMPIDPHAVRTRDHDRFDASLCRSAPQLYQCGTSGAGTFSTFAELANQGESVRSNSGENDAHKPPPIAAVRSMEFDGSVYSHCRCGVE